jgi:hypothetical protein
VGLKEGKGFMDSTHFLVDAAAPISLVVRLVIKIKGENDNSRSPQADHDSKGGKYSHSLVIDSQVHT